MSRLSTPSRVRGFVLVLFVALAALSRLIPHPPNFTAIGAMALFGGATFASRGAALSVPLAAMLFSDLALFALYGWALGPMTAVVYGCIALSSVLGFRLRAGAKPLTIARGSAASALLFFAVTNFAVWAKGALYPLTLEGLAQCYMAALPFLGNSLAGYALYGLALFGGFAWLERRHEALRMGPSPIQAP